MPAFEQVIEREVRALGAPESEECPLEDRWWVEHYLVAKAAGLTAW